MAPEDNDENPNALVEVSDELAALIAGEPEPQSPTAVTPTPEASPVETAPVTPVEPSVPEWFADVPAEQRAAVVQRAIESLPQEERNQLPAIQETARNASSWTANQVKQQTTYEQAQSQADAELEAAATTAATDLKANLHPDSLLNVDTLLNDVVIPAAQVQYHEQIATDIDANGLKVVLAWLGIQEIPAAIVAEIENAPNYGGVIAAYGKLFANRGFDLGVISERNKSTTTSEADKAALTARYKSWGIAQAAKDGRLRISKDDEGLYAELVNDTPVPLGSGAVSGGGDDLSQEEFDKAINDPDYYDRLMANPAKKAAWDRAIAGALSPA